MTALFSAMRRVRRCRSGATAVEFSLVCLPLLLLALGIVEFGRAFYLENNLSYAADIAARKVLIGQVGRNLSESEAYSQLQAIVRENFSGGDPALLQVALGKETVDGIDFRVLSLRYSFTFLVPGLADGPIALGLSRRIPMG